MPATDRLRFHLDECVDPAVAVGLGAHGIDVTTTVGKELRTAADGEQLAFAIGESRVLVTHDDDFLKLPADLHHLGIAYSPADALSLGQMIRWLRLMYEAMRPEEMEERVEYGFGV